MPKILAIEDDASFRRAITKYMVKSGFEVVPAASGTEGLVKALEEPPDLVVCDLMMPGMNGFEVLTSLRKHQHLASIPVVFLTGQSEPAQVREGMNLGADDYLTKPLDLAELVKAIRARLARRQSEQERHQQQLERASELFSGIVHDLRDPLMMVLGYTDQLKSGGDVAPLEGGAGNEILRRMQRAIERMQGIVADTMLLVRSRMRQLPFNPTGFDLRAFCQQMVHDHAEAGRLRFEAGPGEHPIQADFLRLRQALENVLSNGLRYSSGDVTLSLGQAIGGYRLEVVDRGIGIPCEEQRGVFEPFFRGSNATQIPGYGLGLSIARGGIEQHGGRISFVSKPNEGTTFTVLLPAGARPERPAAGEAVTDGRGEPRRTVEGNGSQRTPPAAIRGGNGERGEHVPPPKPAKQRELTRLDGERRPKGSNGASPSLRALILDDDPLVREVLRGFLGKSEGVQAVGEASTLKEALALIAQQAPNTVFLDIRLPDGSGFDLLPHLPGDTAVVFVTVAEEYAVSAFDCEAADYLLKPVSFERLQKALQRVRLRLAPNGHASAAARSRLDETFLVKTLTEKRLVRIGDIIRIIAYGEYSWVYWSKGKGALLRKSLKQWLPELPEAQFVRVHRRAIVNLAYMERVEKLPGGRMQIHLKETAEPILVSLRLSPALNRKLKSSHPEGNG